MQGQTLHPMCRVRSFSIEELNIHAAQWRISYIHVVQSIVPYVVQAGLGESVHKRRTMPTCTSTLNSRTTAVHTSSSSIFMSMQ